MRSTPCDQGRPDSTSVVCLRRLQGKTVWEHSPTRRKYPRLLQLNRGAPLCFHSVTIPPLSPGPTIPVGPPHANLTCQVAPVTGVRVACCHASPPLAPRLGHLGYAKWPQCRVAPRGGPARHVSRRSPRHPAGKNPFFRDFKIENTSKNQIKIK